MTGPGFPHPREPHPPGKSPGGDPAHRQGQHPTPRGPESQSPGSQPKGGFTHACPGGRLNLLLSHAGWRPESWVDALPRMLEPMGVQSHRAQTGTEAKHVLESTQIHIAIVDLALPLDAQCNDRCGHQPDLEEGGSRLLEILSRLTQPPPTVVMKRERNSRDDARDLGTALRLGAFAVVDRPRHQSDVDQLLDVMRRALQRFYQGRWPGA